MTNRRASLTSRSPRILWVVAAALLLPAGFPLAHAIGIVTERTDRSQIPPQALAAGGAMLVATAALRP